MARVSTTDPTHRGRSTCSWRSSPARLPRWGDIRRDRLDTFRVDHAGCRVIVVSAGAGYGKSTVLAHWSVARGDTRPHAFVALNPSDDAPRALLSRVMAALHGIQPLDSTGVGRDRPSRPAHRPRPPVDPGAVCPRALAARVDARRPPSRHRPRESGRAPGPHRGDSRRLAARARIARGAGSSSRPACERAANSVSCMPMASR